jgi:addiction module RelE/StbE family toxin
MRLRWSAAAAGDLENIADFLFEKTLQNAPQLIHRIYDATQSLQKFPNRGRPGKKMGTRELLIPALPYFVVYQVKGDALYIVRILHSSQRWPK